MPDPVSPGGVAPATVDNTSILLDRLCGYDVDEEAGKTKLAIHGYVDALTANLSSWTDKPTDAEVESMFALSGQSFDPTDTQVAATTSIKALITNGTRSEHEVQSILRLGETYPDVITKARVKSMLGL